MTEVIDGEAVAADIRESLSESIETLRAAGVTPGLATVLMSDDPASETYVSMKQQDCEEVGIDGIHAEIDPEAPAAELYETVEELNEDPDVHGILVQMPVPDHVDDPVFVDRVRALDPDLYLSVVAGQRLGAELLSIPDDAVNLHGSLLPKYRGRAVGFWPLYYDDDRTGVTAHVMTGEWDAGPIIERRSFRLSADDTVHDVYRRLSDVGADLACDLLARYPTDFETRPNETTPDDYHTLPTPAERRRFRRRGNAFL